MTAVDPGYIMQVASGYGVSKVLISAVGLGLYTRLAAGSMTLDELAEEFGFRKRPAMDFLDLLVSVNLLHREGEGDEARYGNTPETAAYLDRGQPGYLGGVLELWDNRNYRFWDGITDALRTGEAQSETKGGGKSFFETLYEDPSQLEAFMEAMTGASIRNFEKLAQVFPFGEYRTLADIGGADALLSRTVSTAHPHLKCVSLDLPVVTGIAARKIAEAGLSDRIEAVAGDFLEGPLPKSEVITMGMILHDWNLERKKLLIKKAYDALPSGGAFVVIEHLIDDARRNNTFGLFMSLTMLIELGDAFDFTGAELKSWCEEVGFSRFEVIPLDGPSSAAIVYK